MSTIENTIEITPQSLANLAATRARLRAEAEAATEALKQVDVTLLEGMESLGLTSVVSPDGRVKLTRAQGSRTAIDEALLFANISRSLWNKLTKRRLDSTLYKNAKGLGLISDETLAIVEKTSATAAYLVQS
jgi:hypothetical protein